MADEFVRGANEAGHEVEKIGLYDKTLNYCHGCLSCQRTGKCFMQDDAATILHKIAESDVLVFAAPIYNYSAPAQMKTLIDRSACIYGTNYKFRDIYLLTTSTASGNSGAVEMLQGWLNTFSKGRIKDTVHIAGTEKIGSIIGNSKLKNVYGIGKKL
jgi:multimeric flavodoxin WrbA